MSQCKKIYIKKNPINIELQMKWNGINLKKKKDVKSELSQAVSGNAGLFSAALVWGMGLTQFEKHELASVTLSPWKSVLPITECAHRKPPVKNLFPLKCKPQLHQFLFASLSTSFHNHHSKTHEARQVRHPQDESQKMMLSWLILSA